jgi:hypothetical protein
MIAIAIPRIHNESLLTSRSGGHNASRFWTKLRQLPRFSEKKKNNKIRSHRSGDLRNSPLQVAQELMTARILIEPIERKEANKVGASCKAMLMNVQCVFLASTCHLSSIGSHVACRILSRFAHLFPTDAMMSSDARKSVRVESTGTVEQHKTRGGNMTQFTSTEIALFKEG